MSDTLPPLPRISHPEPHTMRFTDIERRYIEQYAKDYALAARQQAQVPAHGWTDADADAARLALELECLLTDRDVPMPVTSRWWESAHEALALHRQRLESERAAAPQAAQPEQAQQSERDGFEDWAKSYSTFPLERDDHPKLGTTSYVQMEQAMLWDAWQAAHASILARLEAVQRSSFGDQIALGWNQCRAAMLAAARGVME